MPDKTKKEFEFTIGADPEFVLTMQNKKVDAKQTIKLMLSNKTTPQTKIELNKNRDGYNIDKFGDIGWDGAESTAEIRPTASNNPTTIVNNIQQIFKTFIKHIQICDLSTISEFSSIGGHIHVEIPKEQKWTRIKRDIIQKRIASFCLPLLISENKTNLNLRLRQGYGSLNDFKIAQHFKYPDGIPGFTLEIRSPSAEWLTTPKLAQATLAYIGVIYHEILNHPKHFTKFENLIHKNEKQGDALQMLSIMKFDLLTDTILRTTKKYIKTFEKYETYKQEIEYIFNPKQIIKDKQKANYNITIGWNLLDKTQQPTKKDILTSKKRIQTIANKKDFDTLKKVMNIHYNNDTNVALFAETLKDRIAAFNWKIKNNYFIFGIRKGIPEIIARNLKNEQITDNHQSIKTKSDKISIDNLFYTMNHKFNLHNQSNNITIDFITEKPKDLKEKIITIGIPYEMRTKENFKPFLSLIWAIETNSITKPPKYDLIDDNSKKESQKGELYKILTKQTQTQQIIIDRESTSLNSNTQAINSIINTENNN